MYRNFLRGTMKNWLPHSYFTMMEDGEAILLEQLKDLQ